MRSSALFARLKRLGTNIVASEMIGRLIARVYRNKIPSRGSVIATGHPLITPRTKALIYWGRYEHAEARFVSRYLRSDLDTVDLGASIGVVSCLIARRLQPSRRLICVEANPFLVDLLTENLRANAKGTQATAVSGAVDYGGSQTTSLVIGGDSLTASAVTQGSRRVEVPSVNLAALLDTHGISNSYQLVMDIEGSEVGLLRHERDALRRCQLIIAELHDVPEPNGTVPVDALIAMLTEVHGFKLKARHGVVCCFTRPSV